MIPGRVGKTQLLLEKTRPLLMKLLLVKQNGKDKAKAIYGTRYQNK